MSYARSLVLLSSLLTACSPLRSQAPQPPANAMPAYAPQPDDSRLTRGRVFLNRTIVAGNKVTLSGNLPTPCHQLRVVVPERPNNSGILAIEAYSVAEPGGICAQMLKPFTLDITLTQAQALGRITVNREPAGLPDR